jgi:LemA protein
MDIVYALLIILIIICLMVIIYAYDYNKLQDCKLKTDQAENIIDEALRKKYDLIMVVKDIIISNVKDEKINFKDLNDLKEKDISNYDLDRKLNEYLQLINKVKEDYPKLLDNEEFLNNYNQIKRCDEEITAAKKFYNTYIGQSNELVRKFPSNIIAKFHNITIKNFFDGKDMNDNDFNDFKF